MEKGNKTYKLPDGWIEVEIKDISLKINYGYTAKSISNNTGTKLLRITDIQDNHVDWNAVPYCEIDELDKPKFILKSGDIVFARTGATVGKSFLISDNFPDAIFASYLIRIQLSKHVDPKYIYYYFQSGSYWKQIGIKALGVGQPHVNANSLSRLKLPLPSKNHQKNIVSKIEKLFSELDQAEKGLQKAKYQLEIYRKTLLKSAFEGKLTNPNIETGVLPDEWVLSKLGNNGRLICGQHILKNEYNLNKNGIPYFTGPSDFGVNYPKISKWTTKPKVIVTKDDILITVKGSGLGKLNVVQEKSTIGRQLMAYDFTSGSKLYMFYFLLFQSQNIKALGIGSAIPGIDRESILGIACPIPPPKEQKQIVEILESRFTLIENLEKSISRSLNDVMLFKYSVLKKAFEGKMVSQYSNDESAELLLQKIKKEKEEYLIVQKVIDKLIPKKKRQMETKKTVLEILSKSKEPISTQELWTNSIHEGDIESFYSEIKEIYSKLTEVKEDTESLLSLKK